MSQAENLSEVTLSESSNDFSKKIRETLVDISEQANSLETENFAAVGRRLAAMMAQRISSRPYETLLTALGIGFGLGTLNLSNFKRAAIRMGKLIAVRALTEMDSKNTGDTRATKSFDDA